MSEDLTPPETSQQGLRTAGAAGARDKAVGILEEVSEPVSPLAGTPRIVLALIAVPAVALLIGAGLVISSLAPGGSEGTGGQTAPPGAIAQAGSGPSRAADPGQQAAGQKIVAAEETSKEAEIGGPAGAEKPAGVAPRDGWLTLDAGATLTRIGVGSCLDQARPQPIWAGVLGLEKRPELFLMIGDNVYGDIKSDLGWELAEAYRQQAIQPELAAARAAMPFLATWDDHDYGLNDGGAQFPQKAIATRLFKEFWQFDPGRGDEAGIHYARIFGPEGRRVQIIMLDTRSFRSPLQPKSASFPHWGRYEPVEDPARTMLGREQWEWLRGELEKPAEIRLVVSSVQVLAEGHGFERWGNLPLEKEKLLALIEETGARGVVLLSGDRHSGSIYGRSLPGGRLLPELTSSSLNRAYGPSKDARIGDLLTDIYHAENFGLVDIDWEGRRIALALHGMGGEALDTLWLRFSDLGLD